MSNHRSSRRNGKIDDGIHGAASDHRLENLGSKLKSLNTKPGMSSGKLNTGTDESKLSILKIAAFQLLLSVGIIQQWWDFLRPLYLIKANNHCNEFGSNFWQYVVEIWWSHRQKNSKNMIYLFVAFILALQTSEFCLKYLVRKYVTFFDGTESWNISSFHEIAPGDARAGLWDCI